MEAVVSLMIIVKQLFYFADYATLLVITNLMH